MNILAICIPVFNESKFIDNLILSIIHSPPKEKEIILIDGQSTDDTVEKIKKWQVNYPNIKLIDNRKKYVSDGFNLAYQSTHSKYISLIGAHSEYPLNYFELGLSFLESDLADAVGGPLNQKGRSEKGKIIAACMSSRFGVGNTDFRISKKRGYVQSVAMAIYKRRVFKEIGLLDEELHRNQDDEFHYRMNSRGYKILMDPGMEVTYYVRDDFRSLWYQYFEYGLYKPLVFKKVKSSIRLRHLVPPIFVCYLLFLPLFLILSWYTILPLLLYLLLTLYFSGTISTQPKVFFYAVLAFYVLHLSYGAGMMFGLRKLV